MADRDRPAAYAAERFTATHPSVRGVCPACGTALLFLGSEGYITCSLHNCPDPVAADRLLQHSRSVTAALRLGVRIAQASDDACGASEAPPDA